MAERLLDCERLTQIYRVGSVETIALQGLDLTIDRGEMVGIVGPSGSGKSTLLKVISGVLRPSGGSVTFDGLDLGTASDRRLDTYRRHELGFVWQENEANLLGYLTARRNVALMLELDGQPDADDRAGEWLDRVGLGDRGDHRPAQLSGGEQQRVALAAALVTEPTMLLADEPTAALDSAGTEAAFSLMREIGRETGLTQVIVSHDRELARHVDRVVDLRDGRVATEHRLAATGDQVDEVSLVDRMGRVQLSEAQQEALGNADRLRVDIADGTVVLRPAGEASDEAVRDD